jgi:hypothetical protein
MMELGPHLFGALVLVSTVGAMMVWIAMQTSLAEERREDKRCAACGRLIRRWQVCRCSRNPGA